MLKSMYYSSLQMQMIRTDRPM